MLLPGYSKFSLLSILDHHQLNHSSHTSIYPFVHVSIIVQIHFPPYCSLWFLKQVKKGLLTLVVRTRLGTVVGSQTQVAQLCRSKSLSSTAGISRASDELADFPNLGTHARPRDRIMMEITLQKGQYKWMLKQRIFTNFYTNLNYITVWMTVCFFFVCRGWCGPWYWVVLRSICWRWSWNLHSHTVSRFSGTHGWPLEVQRTFWEHIKPHLHKMNT